MVVTLVRPALMPLVKWKKNKEPNFVRICLVRLPRPICYEQNCTRPKQWPGKGQLQPYICTCTASVHAWAALFRTNCDKIVEKPDCSLGSSVSRSAEPRFTRHFFLEKHLRCHLAIATLHLHVYSFSACVGCAISYRLRQNCGNTRL